MLQNSLRLEIREVLEAGPFSSYRYSEGGQAGLRVRENEALLVAHRFGGPISDEIRLPLPKSGNWQIARALADFKP